MQHRLKNLFASVLSIAAQTSQGGQTSAEFMKAFEGRVLALAAAHDLLSQDESADLAELTRRIVGPFAGADAIEIAGKPFKVAPSSVVPFSLVLHELATNAAKYGALSNAQGRARISWKYYRAEKRRAALQVQVGGERRAQRGAAAAQRLRHDPDEARLRRRRGPGAADARAGRPALQGRRTGERQSGPPAGGRGGDLGNCRGLGRLRR